jgi:hypothetical protein
LSRNDEKVTSFLPWGKTGPSPPPMQFPVLCR